MVLQDGNRPFETGTMAIRIFGHHIFIYVGNIINEPL